MIKTNNSLYIIVSALISIAWFSSLALAEPKLYFSSTDVTVGIFSSDLDGQNIQTLYDPNGSGADPGRIAIDDIDSKLYFVVPSEKKIKRLNIDGGPIVIEDFATLPIAPTFISIDVPGRGVFWTNDSFQTRRQGIYTNVVEEMDYTGNNEIAVAPLHNLIFTNDSARSEIYSYQLNPFELFNVPSLFKTIDNKAISILHKSGKIVHGLVGSTVVLTDIAKPNTDTETLFTFPDVTLWSTSSNHDERYVYYALSSYIGKTFVGSGDETIMINDPAYSYLGLALDCGTFALDTDEDGTPNCGDACPSDALKTTPGDCGCGISDADSDGDGVLNCFDQCPADNLKAVPGACGCGVLEDAGNTDGDSAINCLDHCPTDNTKTDPGLCGCGISDSLFNNPVSCQPFEPTHTPQPTSTPFPPLATPTPIVIPDVTAIPGDIILEKGTKITVPPEVVVANRTVQIFLIKFTKVIFKPKKNKKDPAILEAKATKITYRYKVNVRNNSEKKKETYTLNSKKNVLTLKNLKPGNYSVNYRAEILKDGEVASKTNLSPTASFSVQ